MKITTNDFGNYTAKLSRTAQTPKAEQTNTAEIQKQKLGTVTSEEKKFFAGLYPENKEDVMNYHFYHKNGKMQGVSLGTIFDKRG